MLYKIEFIHDGSEEIKKMNFSEPIVNLFGSIKGVLHAEQLIKTQHGYNEVCIISYERDWSLPEENNELIGNEE